MAGVHYLVDTNVLLRLVTFNDRDFARYSGIPAAHPRSIFPHVP